MPYKKGDKFTVEITEVLTGDDGRLVYRLNDMPYLVFDVNQLNDLGLKKSVEPEKKSPFERAERGVPYYYIAPSGVAGGLIEDRDDIDDGHFSVANYCTDKSLMEQRALHETLNRLLWRYSEEHGGDPEWDMTKQHWYILNDKCNGGNLDTDYNEAFHVFGVPYFTSEAVALSAIHDIVEPFMKEHLDFVW